MLEQESCAEPEGSIVKTYYSADVVAAACVVTGAELPFSQEAAGEKFHGENQGHIGEASHK